MILLGTYISSWDDGIDLESKCLIDTATGVVTCNDKHDAEVNILDEHYVVIDDVRFELTEPAGDSLVINDVAAFRKTIQTLVMVD
jgi:hypothetical protein